MERRLVLVGKIGPAFRTGPYAASSVHLTAWGSVSQDTDNVPWSLSLAFSVMADNFDQRDAYLDSFDA